VTDAATTFSLVEAFEARVASNPHAIAVDDGSKRLTYDQLNRQANRLARAIAAQPTAADKPVAFLLEHGTAQIVAILALLKSGRIAVALDPAYPPARLSAMIADSGCELILTCAVTENLKAKLAVRLASLDVESTEGFADGNLQGRYPGGHYANIYYTSGSTGEPKGVIQTHENIFRFAQEMSRDWNVTAADRVIQIVTCSFSAVLLPILVPLLNGAAVVPFDLRRQGPARLRQAIAELGISILFCVPSVFRALSAATDAEPVKSQSGNSLRLCVFTGEPLYADDAKQLWRIFGPACSVRNLLGGSEMHHVATLQIDFDECIGSGVLPAGLPANGKEILIVNERGECVPVGEAGELLVRSRHLSPGYWRRPDLTRDAFIEAGDDNGMRGYRSRDLGRMRPDGLLELLGRADSRINLRGQLVETAAIEAVLTAFPQVSEAAVGVQSAGAGSERLVAWVVGADSLLPDLAGLKAGLAAALPPYMVPEVFIRRHSLPRTATGKLDRASLPSTLVDNLPPGQAYVSPRNALESMVTTVVENILGIHPVGIRDDLFDLGLNSLLYADLHAILEKKLGRAIPEDLFIRARTVEQILAHVSESTIEKPIQEVPAGAQEYGKSWRRLNLEMQTRYQIARLIGLVMPFKLAVAGLEWLCRQRWFQSSWPVRDRVLMIRELVASLDTRMDPEVAVARSLKCNLFQPWLLGTLRRCRCGIDEGELLIEGLEHYDAAVERGKGVILAVSHYGLPHLDLLALERAGRGRVLTLGSFPFELKLLGLAHLPHVPLTVEPVGNFLFRVNFLRHANDVLRSGGTVRLAADGLHGANVLTLAFNGRVRRFRPGFAELALDTGAAVVPVFAVMTQQDLLRVEFLPSLETTAGAVSRPEAIRNMVEKYVGLLEQSWKLDPGHVVWEIAQAHMASPLLTE